MTDAMGFSVGAVGVRILKDEAEMGEVTARHVIQRLKENAREARPGVFWTMAAPSAFAFYGSLIRHAAEDAALAAILKRIHYFQFDDYPFKRGSAAFAATFRQLLAERFFGPLAAVCGPLDHIHALELCGDAADAQVADAYLADLLKLRSEGAFLLQLKGIGMDGHWGFHGAETPLEAAPAIVQVEIGDANGHQQMKEWPQLFPDRGSLPKKAFTCNVSAFLLAHEIIDNVPQAAKEYSVLASYGTEQVLGEVPSSAIKKHPKATAYLAYPAARALLEFKEMGHLSRETWQRLDALWSFPEDPALEAANIRTMRHVLGELGIV